MLCFRADNIVALLSGLSVNFFGSSLKKIWKQILDQSDQNIFVYCFNTVENKQLHVHSTYIVNVLLMISGVAILTVDGCCNVGFIRLKYFGIVGDVIGDIGLCTCLGEPIVVLNLLLVLPILYIWPSGDERELCNRKKMYTRLFKTSDLAQHFSKQSKMRKVLLCFSVCQSNLWPTELAIFWLTPRCRQHGMPDS